MNRETMLGTPTPRRPVAVPVERRAAPATGGGSIASGIGTGVILTWFWNAYAVTRWGQPEMPGEVAAVIAGAVIAGAEAYVKRRRAA
jgi:hypothetical protein